MQNQTVSPFKDAIKALDAAGTLRWFHWVVVALSLCLTLFVWDFSRTQVREKSSMQFEREADQAVELVIERMKKYEDALWAGAAFMSTQGGDVDHQLWQRYASLIQIEQKYPGINGIGLIVALSASQVPDFLQTQRVQRPDYTIHPPRIAAEYWPIHSIVPLAGNELAVGLDMAHEANRFAAAQNARKTGTAQITGAIVLVQDSMKTPGFLFYAPFYQRSLADGDEATKSGAAESNEFAGLVYAPFVVRKLMEGTLQKRKRQVGIRITDGAQVLFDEHLAAEPDFDPQPLFKKQISIPLYGREWEFDIWSAKSFRENVDHTQPATILVAGFVIDGLLVVLLLVLSQTSRRALGLAGEMNADLEKLGLATRVNKIGVWDYDPNLGTLQWNSAMLELHGRDTNDFTGNYIDWCQCLHPDDRIATEQALQRALEGKANFDCEYRVVQPQGSIRFISAKAVVFRDPSGRPVRVLGANTDVTEQKTVAQDLDAERRLKSAIQDAAGVAIIATDLQGIIVSFNTTAEQMLGYSKEEMLFCQSPAVFHDPHEVAERAIELTEELKREILPGFEVFVAKATRDGAEQREWTYVRKEGSRLPVLLTVTELRDHNNNVTGYLGVAADISERKLALQEIEKANETLARSNEELAQFAYVASHDLQEPLRKVASFCELLDEDCSEQLSDDGQRYLAYILDGARRMRTLIQDLLAYCRIESDSLHLSSVDTNETIQLAISHLSEAIRESQAVVHCDTLPNVQADPGQLVQLFQNVIGNAIKYRGDQAPQVQIRCQTVDERLTFSVEDNGIGIAPAHREQIFGIFKRLHNHNEYKGTGIGLAVCKRIVERLGGRMWVEASASGGSIFRFSLPRQTSQPAPTNIESSLQPEAQAFAIH